jgi:hypothetical protein
MSHLNHYRGTVAPLRVPSRWVFVETSNDGARPERCWQEIVADAGKETNLEKLAELSEELDRALDERRKNIPRTDIKRKIA